MRAAFSRALVALARQDSRVLLITGDHGYALFDDFRRECPDQYINAGIAEQNMVGLAAGMARAGFVPFVYGLSAFVPIRVLEQIKLDVAHDNLHVVFLGDGAGFVYSHLGTSHQSTEDIACLRAIPGMTILSPADRHEMTASMSYAYAAGGPVYLRMGKADRGDVHEAPVLKLESGRMLQLRTGRRELPAVLATGSMAKTAMNVVERFGFQASVWSAPVIKPLEVADVSRLATEHPGLVVMEEHSVLGGFGSAVAEICAEHAPCRVLRIGVNDRFSQHCGSYDYLLGEHKLDEMSVWEKINAFFSSL